MDACPVCGHLAGDLPELQAHVNSHFVTELDDLTESSSGTVEKPSNEKRQDGPNGRALGGSNFCPICWLEVEDVGELEKHVNNHLLEDEKVESKRANVLVLRNQEATLEKKSTSTQSKPVTKPHTNPSCEESSSETGRKTSDKKKGKESNGSKSGSSNFCPICWLEMEDIDELECHVNCHLLEDENSKSEGAMALVTENQAEKLEKKPSSGRSKPGRKPYIPPSWKDSLKSCSPGVVERIRSLQSGNRRSTMRVCNDCSHLSTQGMPDKGYGCGYRNLQMVLSCLCNNPLFLDVVFQGSAFIPSVYRLQSLLEEAWDNGFDPVGALQLNGKVVRTRKWIGTTEVATVLSYLKVRCQIYDFAKKVSGSVVAHPSLEACVRSYFDSDNVWKAPMYFQHQGHSRVIVGFEERGDGFRLLILDPGMPKHELERIFRNAQRAIGRGGGACLPEEISMPLSSFKSVQYQIVSVLGVMEDDAEVQRSKLLTSIKMS